MSLSKERKAYLAVMGLGVAAVIVDRVVLDGGMSGPSSASAGSTVVETAVSSGSDPRANIVAVADLLGAASAGARARDSFAMPTAWIAAKVVADAPDGTSIATPSEDRVVRRDLKLTGVMSTGGVVRAIVNGMVLTLGEDGARDGMRLVQIGERWAIIDVNGERVRLTMDPGDEEESR